MFLMSKEDRRYLRVERCKAMDAGDDKRVQAINKMLEDPSRLESDVRRTLRVMVTYPSGEQQGFPSTYRVTQALGISYSSLIGALDHGRVLTKGIRKGYRFEIVGEGKVE